MSQREQNFFRRHRVWPAFRLQGPQRVVDGIDHGSRGTGGAGFARSDLADQVVGQFTEWAVGEGGQGGVHAAILGGAAILRDWSVRCAWKTASLNHDILRNSPPVSGDLLPRVNTCRRANPQMRHASVLESFAFLGCIAKSLNGQWSI